MSQAHYFGVCSWFVDPYACTDDVVALLHVPMGRGNPTRPVCKTHLDVWLDWSDGDLLGPMKPEPLKIDWVWDAGTRTCPIHRWPAVLCEGWNDEHHLIKRGAESYSDLACRLTSDLRFST